MGPHRSPRNYGGRGSHRPPLRRRRTPRKVNLYDEAASLSFAFQFECHFENLQAGSLQYMCSHVQCFAHRRVSPDAPDFRVKVVVNEGVAPQEGYAELHGEGLNRSAAAAAMRQAHVAEILSRSLINHPEDNSKGNVKNEPAADQ